MKVKSGDWLSKLLSVSAGLSKSPNVEGSDCFNFFDDKIFTFNGLVACSVDWESGIRGSVEANTLLSLLRNMKHDELEVQEVDGSLVLKAPGDEAIIAMGECVLSLAEVAEKRVEWKDLPDGFWDAVSFVQDCCSTTRQSFCWTCVHFCSGYVEASDRYQLARAYTPIVVDRDFLVSKDALKHIVEMRADKFSESDKWVHFRTPDGATLSCLRYVEDYPSFDPFINVEGKELKFPKAIHDVINSASCCDEDGYLEVSLRGNKVRIVGEGKSSRYRGVRDCVWEGDDLKFFVSSKILMKISKQESVLVGENRLKVQTDKWVYITVTSSSI